MIVTSDNESATRLYQDVGGADGVRVANRTLGLGCTEPNEHYWGLTLTCATLIASTVPDWLDGRLGRRFGESPARGGGAVFAGWRSLGLRVHDGFS